MSTFIFFLLSILVRISFLPLPGFKADIAYWKWWGMTAAHDGITGPLLYTAYNYPSFYLYILKTSSHLYEFLTGYNYKLNPHDYLFWTDTNLLYLILIKTPYILADLGIGILIYKIIMQFDDKNKNFAAQLTNFSRSRIVRSAILTPQKNLVRCAKQNCTKVVALIASMLYLFNPVTIYNSSIWGQTDSIGSFLVLLSLYGLLKNNLFLLAFSGAVALFMKTQTVIFLPLIFFALYKLKSENGAGLKSVIKALWIFTGTVIFINLPFLATHTMDRVFDIMYTSQLYFPYVSMNAYNLWWIIFGKASASFWDQNLIAGLLTFKSVGVILFGACYLLSLSILNRIKTVKSSVFCDPDALKKISLSLTVSSFAFFMLLTQMHERYLFPLFAFYSLFLGLLLVNAGKARRLTVFHLVCFFLISILNLINLHQVMVMNYPDNTLLFFPNLFSENLTRIVSVLNLAVFIAVVSSTLRSFSALYKSFWAGIIFLMLFLASIPRFLLIDSDTVRLTTLNPTVKQQGYGQLAINKNLANGWLSSLYYFSDNGLATHANSLIVYHINGRYKTFRTGFGVDTDANTNASVHFLIKGDGKLLFKSTKIGRYSLPGFTKIDIEGVKTLELLVDDGGDGINSDHADWFAPTLYR